MHLEQVSFWIESFGELKSLSLNSNAYFIMESVQGDQGSKMFYFYFIFLCIIKLSLVNVQSTASFFQDHSVSLGRLIGIRPRDRGHLCISSQICFEERHRLSRRGSHKSGESKGHEGICLPLMACTMIITSRSKSKPIR